MAAREAGKPDTYNATRIAVGDNYPDMNANSESAGKKGTSARWIASGFIAAFAASIATVILTGLNVQGSGRALDAGFLSVTMSVGDVRPVEFRFESGQAQAEASLAISLPDIVVATNAAAAGSRQVSLVRGENRFAIEVRAVAPGSGFVVASLDADEPVAGQRVFVTVVAP